MALKADKAMWTTCCKSIWRQKARMNWCKLGDRNTKIFHLRCSNRWRKNSILRISDGSSSFTNALSIKKVILDHFKDRFCQLKPFSGFYPNMALQYLSSEMGLNLELPFSLDEIKAMVWDCDSTKAPGPDGANFFFYKRAWILIKDDLLELFNSFFSSASLPSSIHAFFIALILKVRCASKAQDFRPIFLINGI